MSQGMFLVILFAHPPDEGFALLVLETNNVIWYNEIMPMQDKETSVRNEGEGEEDEDQEFKYTQPL